MLSIIVAKDKNNIIGRENMLPWMLADDLRRFQQLTTGHTVIMGRKTFESIGQPLPRRENIVLTRSNKMIPGVHTIHSLEEIQQYPDAFIIGGAELYRLTMNMADRLYVTEVNAEIQSGDATFPPISPTIWKEISREKHYAGPRDQYDVEYVVYERKR